MKRDIRNQWMPAWPDCTLPPKALGTRINPRLFPLRRHGGRFWRGCGKLLGSALKEYYTSAKMESILYKDSPMLMLVKMCAQHPACCKI